jgi:hypothetical protein
VFALGLVWLTGLVIHNDLNDYSALLCSVAKRHLVCNWLVSQTEFKRLSKTHVVCLYIGINPLCTPGLRWYSIQSNIQQFRLPSSYLKFDAQVFGVKQEQTAAHSVQYGSGSGRSKRPLTGRKDGKRSGAVRRIGGCSFNNYYIDLQMRGQGDADTPSAILPFGQSEGIEPSWIEAQYAEQSGHVPTRFLWPVGARLY